MSATTYPFYLGGLSAIMASCCTHPIDREKYRQQVQLKKVPLMRSLASSYSSNGVVALWEGVSASVCRQATYSTARFLLYDYIKGIATKGQEGPTPLLVLAGCAGAAGGLAGIIGNPFEIVLVRMCTDALKDPSKRFNYFNGAQAVYLVAKTEGIRSLYRGVGPNIFRSVLMNVSQLAVYDSLKRSLVTERGMKDTLPLHFLLGAVAGTVATTACAPVDVLKSRVQTTGGQVSLLKICADGAKSEGLGFFFRGWTPAWLRLTPNSIIMFIFLEQLKSGVDSIRSRRAGKKVQNASQIIP